MTPQEYLIELRADVARTQRKIKAKPTRLSSRPRKDQVALRETLQYYKELLAIAEANFKPKLD